MYLVNFLHLRSLPDADVSSHNKQLGHFWDREFALLFKYRRSNVAVHEREELLEVKLIREGL
jgi:hypothetical protein